MIPDLRRIGRYELDEMELIGNNMFTVGVPSESDAEFKAYIMAAGTAYAWGQKSIDNVLRRHGERWVENFDGTVERSNTRSAYLRHAVVQRAALRCAAISKLDLSTGCPGLIASANSQIRLESTFRAACHLIWLGFPFEAEAVTRLGFEQVAWAYTVHALDEPEKVVVSSGANKTITRLKTLLPQAGRIYGELTAFAHIYPRVHNRFITTTEEGVTVSIRSPAVARESMLLVLILLDAFFTVSSTCFPGVDTELDSRNGHEIVSSLVSGFADVLPSDALARFEQWLRVDE